MNILLIECTRKSYRSHAKLKHIEGVGLYEMFNVRKY